MNPCLSDKAKVCRVGRIIAALKTHLWLHTLCCLFITLGNLNTTAQNAEQLFLWEQANTQMMNASKPEDYIQAAETYRRLLADEIVNPALLNNLGSALTMGGDYKNAQKAFERAERYAGVTDESRAGITAALARAAGSADADEPWYRTAFFWHFGLPTDVRGITALSGWFMLWIGILLLLLNKNRNSSLLTAMLSLSETLIFTGTLIFLLFGTSTLVSIVQEHQESKLWPAIEFTTAETTEVPQ